MPRVPFNFWHTETDVHREYRLVAKGKDSLDLRLTWQKLEAIIELIGLTEK